MDARFLHICTEMWTFGRDCLIIAQNSVNKKYDCYISMKKEIKSAKIVVLKLKLISKS